MRFHSPLVGLCLAIVSACASGNSPADSGVSADQACADLAKAYCNTYAGCSAFELARTYGSLATCMSQQQASCVLGLGDPQTSRTPASVESCATAEETWDCGDFFAAIPQPACAPTAGGLAAGAVCTSSFQCQSTFCQLPITGGVCGTCQPPSTAGQSCQTFGCSRGFVCGSDTHTCLAPVSDGGACTDSNLCLDSLACFGFDGGNGSGTCVPEGLLGATCDDLELTAPGCETRQGLSCISKVCVTVTLQDAGAACGEIDAGPRACPADAGTTCIVSEPINCLADGDCVESGGAAACVPPAGNGSACDVSVGPGCLTPAKCVLDAGTAGTCQLADPTLCGS